MPLNEAGKRVKFGPVDGMALYPFLFLLLSPSKTTFMFLLGFTGVLVVLDYFGIKVDTLIRLIRSYIVGNNRIIRPATRIK